MSDKNISIIGIGRLGICVGLCLEHSGYNVLGVDVFPDYVDKINNKTLDSPEPHVNELLRESKNFRATTNLDEAIAFSDLLLVYVATPSSGGEKFYDHDMLGKVLMKINQRKVENKHVVIGCTVIPGYIRDVGNFLLKDCVNTSLSYNPEFIAQGDIINGMFYPDFILIGEGTKMAGNRLEKMYNTIHKNIPIAKGNPSNWKMIECPPIRRMSPSSAEITKLSVNCFVTTKIAFANMIGDLADVTEGADKFDILTAVGSDKRIGNRYLKPGYGFGGPCFPRDNRALGGYIEKMGIEPLIPNATDLSNKLHTTFQADHIYNEHIRLNRKSYVVEGAGYKEPCNVPIIEESQKLFIGRYLAEKGVEVIIRDKKHMLDAVKLEYGNLFNYEET
uniref:UDP-glucose 6-dehydrogenase n=1 Tax=viral metagenome TaxID=1070528 RepID=A0A6C0JPU4_9ZZZZ